MNRHQGKGDVQLQGFPCHYLSGVFLKLWGVRKRCENILGLQTEIVLAPPPDLYILSLFIGYFFINLWSVHKKHVNILGLQTEMVLSPPPIPTPR